MRIKATFVELLLCVLGLGLVAAPAQASDEELRDAVEEQSTKAEAAAERWAKAADDPEGLKELRAAAKAATRASKAIATYRKTVAPISADSAKVKRGKSQLISALKKYESGFDDYASAIDKIDADAPRSEWQSDLDRFVKRLESAAKQEDSALKLIGVEVEED